MRFTERNNFAVKLFWLLFLIIACQSFAACQSQEKKIAKTLELCQSILDKDDLQKAASCYEKAIYAYPDKATEISKAGEDAVFEKCVAYYDSKNYRQSVVCFEAIIGLDSGKASYYYYLADSYLNYFYSDESKTQDLLHLAEQAIQKGLEIRSNSALAYEIYGQILEAQGKQKKAYNESLYGTKRHKLAVVSILELQRYLLSNISLVQITPLGLFHILI